MEGITSLHLLIHPPTHALIHATHDITVYAANKIAQNLALLAN